MNATDPSSHIYAQGDCPICLGECLKAAYCLVCGDRHEGGVTDYEWTDKNGRRAVTREEFAKLGGFTFDAHEHTGADRMQPGTALQTPMTDNALAWRRYEQSKAAHAELVRRGAIK